jgi:hypothetical protein
MEDIAFDWEITFNDEHALQPKFQTISEVQLDACISSYTVHEYKIQFLSSFQILQVADAVCVVTKQLLEDDVKYIVYKQVLRNRGLLMYSIHFTRVCLVKKIIII